MIKLFLITESTYRTEWEETTSGYLVQLPAQSRVHRGVSVRIRSNLSSIKYLIQKTKQKIYVHYLLCSIIWKQKNSFCQLDASSRDSEHYLINIFSILTNCSADHNHEPTDYPSFEAQTSLPTLHRSNKHVLICITSIQKGKNNMRLGQGWHNRDVMTEASLFSCPNSRDRLLLKVKWLGFPQ